MILALDIGTSSVRASIYRSDASMMRRTLVKNERRLSSTEDGGSEIEADEALAQVIGAVDAVLEKTGKLKGEIELVAASSFWHSLVGVDADGDPTTRVFGWADTRSREYTDVLRSKFEEAEVHSRTGARFHSSFWPAKLLWLRKMFPEKFAATEKWLSFSDYVALKLFGEPVTSLSMASGTGIFDIRKCEWDRELLKFLKINVSNLPPIPANDDQVLSLVKTYAKRWPRLAGAKWFPAIADGAANNIGSGCVTASRAALMVGTSGAMRVVYTGEPPERIPDGLWCYRVDRKRLILGGALSDGGGLYRWLEETLKLPKDAEQVIAGREPGLHGLVFLPFVAGERSTGYHESARGSIIGLTTAADPVDILHAAFESVAFRFAAIFDQMNKVLDVTEIVASGGALRKSAVWTQIIADVLGRDLTMPTADEASSRGAVLLALESVGKIESIEPPTNTGSIFVKCDRVRHQTYQKEFERHSLAYDCLIQSKS